MNPRSGPGSCSSATITKDLIPTDLQAICGRTGRLEQFNQERPLNQGCSPPLNLSSSSTPGSTVDLSPVSSRCSVRLIHDLVSKFNTEKMELVRSIGFEGLLHLPEIKQINLRFSAWLMSRVDERNQTLFIEDGSRIRFAKGDVARVFGIPAAGSSIFSKSVNVDSGHIDDTSLDQPIDTKQLRSIKAAQGIVSKIHVGPMTYLEQDEFRAAFLVLVMSTLLAPNAKHDRVSDDYLHILCRPRQIGMYDWSEYVLRRLLDSVSKLKGDIANNVKVPYMHGCSLFLQVLYLDSIDLGLLSMEHNVFPRIRCFTSDRLKSMIAADVSFSGNGVFLPRPCTIKIRNAGGVCYYWANRRSSINSDSINHASMLELWEVSLLMTRVLKIPPETAGPLFIAVSDFQRKVKSAPVTEPMMLVKAILLIMEPYVNGFSYQSSINVNLQPSELCAVGRNHTCETSDCSHHVRRSKPKRSFNNQNAQDATVLSIGCSPKKACHSGNGLGQLLDKGPSFIDGLDNSGSTSFSLLDSDMEEYSVDTHMMAIIAMSRFYLTIRPVKTTRCSDLNAPPKACCSGQLAGTVDAGRAHGVSRSPWELGFCVNIDPVKVDDISKKLRFVEETDEPWIVHFCPKYIEVITCALKSQFSGCSEFEMELFDAVIRRYKQVDDELYLNEGSLRWRHFVESDFMVSAQVNDIPHSVMVLTNMHFSSTHLADTPHCAATAALVAGWFDIADPVIRAHFCGRHISYDITSCQILFFPCILHYRWVCFAWRLYDNTIVVYDPFVSVQSHSDVLASYTRIVELLRKSMMVVSSILLPRCSFQWLDARVEIFNYGGCLPASMNRSGLLCLHFCRCFDGHQLRPPLHPGQLQDWSAIMIEELSQLSGNMGTVPQNFR